MKIARVTNPATDDRMAIKVEEEAIDATEPEASEASAEEVPAVPDEQPGEQVESALEPQVPQEMASVVLESKTKDLPQSTGDWRTGGYRIQWNGTEFTARAEPGGDRLVESQIIKLPSMNPNQDASALIIIVPIKPKPDEAPEEKAETQADTTDVEVEQK